MLESSKPRYTRVAAYGLIVRDGRILLCRISSALPANAGEWTLPGGGIEFGEDPADAVVREVREETGLRVKVKDLVTIDSRNFEFADQLMHAIRIIYRASVVGGELAYEVAGTTDLCAWLAPEEAQKLPLVGLARRGLKLILPE